MASRKIIFLIVVGILWVLIILGIVSVANKRETQQNTKVPSLSIWVVWWTSEDYWKVFSWFNALSPVYKDTLLDIRVFPNYSNYRDILLSTLADGNGPDIFMIEGSGDDILTSKSVSIPEPYVDLSDFEKRYDDIFLPLLVTEWEGDTMVRSILWAPLWYETLWVFYNKSYFTNVPKTWTEVWLLYANNKNYFPVNIWLGPRYTPDATDIISLFFANNGVYETKNISSGGWGLEEYLRYGTTPLIPSNTDIAIAPEIDSEGSIEETTEVVINTAENTLDSALGNKTLASLRKYYDETGYSTLDSFIRGEIGMIIGFPSTVREIEKAQKRAWAEAVWWLILTERLPQNSVGKGSINIARYRYLALSAKSANPGAGSDFIRYLMSQTTLAATAEAFPYLISPDRTISQLQWQNSLSLLFARARLDAFIPEVGDALVVFNYGLKNEFEKIYEDFLDRNDKIDINNLLSQIKDAVDCKIESSIGWVLSDKCLK